MPWHQQKEEQTHVLKHELLALILRKSRPSYMLPLNGAEKIMQGVMLP